MSSPEDIAALKRRLDGLEAELALIKARLAEIEPPVGLAPEPVEESATPLPRDDDEAAVREPAVTVTPSSSAPVEAPTSSPPLLPPRLGEPRASVAPPEPRATTLRQWLEPLQLWPPSGEEDAEVRLAAWWATRLGALLAVIGVVFLGVYVSRNASPWVRLAEVSAVTAFVIGLGAWLQQRLPKFGGVVFGAGLALAYFCAFAAYAIPPMKVIATPLTAMIVELAVVLAILATAWWRNAPVVATMAVALGHVTAFLALRHGLGDSGPWVVLTLASAAVWLRLARQWEAPSIVAMPLAWAFLGVAFFTRGGATRFDVGEAWLWTGIYFVLFMTRDWVNAWRGDALSTGDRTVQVTSSSLAVAVGLAAAARSGGTALTTFYFGSALVMLGASAAWRWAGTRAMVAIFACKATALLALGLIAALEGHARSLVLLAQAFVLMESTRRSQLRGLRTMTLLTAAVALIFFLAELPSRPAALFTGEMVAQVVFVVSIVVFLGLAQRWLALGGRFLAIASLLVAGAAMLMVARWQVSGWAPAAHVALALAVAAIAAPFRAWAPAGIVSGVIFLGAHVAMISGGVNAATRWPNEGVLLLAALLAGWAIERGSAAADAGGSRSPGLARWLLAGVSLATFVVVYFQAVRPGPALAASSVIAAAVMAAAPWLKRWPLVALSTPLLALGGILYADAAPSPDRWLAVAALVSWALPVWMTASPRHAEMLAAHESRARLRVLQTALATLLTLAALGNLHGAWRLGATGLAALTVAGLMRWPGLRPALEASWVLWVAAVLTAVAAGASALGWATALASWVPALLLTEEAGAGAMKTPPPRWRSRAEGIQVALATALGVVLAFDHRGAAQLVALAGVLAAAYAAWAWGRVAPARRACVIVAGVAWLAAMSVAGSTRAQGWGAGLAAVVAIAIVIAAVPFLVERGLEPVARRRLRTVAAAAGVGLSFYALALQRGEVAPYATVGWGLAAVATFLAGLIARSRPHRLCGLAGLALCIPRAFVVDLDSTLHRIVAFVALGVVLLWVGFSYHRFRHLVVDEEKKL